MPFSNADLLAIKAELNNNPLALTGYLPLANSANDEANANALNLVRVQCQVDRESVPVSDVVKAIDADEFIALSQPQRDYVALITNGGSVNPKSGGEVREAMLQFFGAPTETRASLNALLTESASRITQLFKAGTLSFGGLVTPSDVSNARNAT
jgi:hypothetical protein